MSNSTSIALEHANLIGYNCEVRGVPGRIVALFASQGAHVLVYVEQGDGRIVKVGLDDLRMIRSPG